jgi:hypothetical protein
MSVSHGVNVDARRRGSRPGGCARAAFAGVHNESTAREGSVAHARFCSESPAEVRCLRSSEPRTALASTAHPSSTPARTSTAPRGTAASASCHGAAGGGCVRSAAGRSRTGIRSTRSTSRPSRRGDGTGVLLARAGDTRIFRRSLTSGEESVAHDVAIAEPPSWPRPVSGSWRESLARSTFSTSRPARACRCLGDFLQPSISVQGTCLVGAPAHAETFDPDIWRLTLP